MIALDVEALLGLIAFVYGMTSALPVLRCSRPAAGAVCVR